MLFLRTSRFRLIAFIWAACLCYMLFQGGKLSFLLFSGFTAIVIYLFTVSKSGISAVQMSRSITAVIMEQIRQAPRWKFICNSIFPVSFQFLMY